MPHDHRVLSEPLTRPEIQRLLQILFHDPHAPPGIAIEAFAVTAAALYDWCDPSDVDVALAVSAVSTNTRKIPATNPATDISSQCHGAAPN